MELSPKIGFLFLIPETAEYRVVYHPIAIGFEPHRHIKHNRKSHSNYVKVLCIYVSMWFHFQKMKWENQTESLPEYGVILLPEADIKNNLIFKE